MLTADNKLIMYPNWEWHRYLCRTMILKSYSNKVLAFGLFIFSFLIRKIFTHMTNNLLLVL